MSPAQEFDHNVMLLTQTKRSDYEDLCRLDVLELRDSVEHEQGVVFDEFKEKLRRPQELVRSSTTLERKSSTLPSREVCII